MDHTWAKEYTHVKRDLLSLSCRIICMYRMREIPKQLCGQDWNQTTFEWNERRGSDWYQGDSCVSSIQSTWLSDWWLCCIVFVFFFVFESVSLWCLRQTTPTRTSLRRIESVSSVGFHFNTTQTATERSRFCFNRRFGAIPNKYVTIQQHTTNKNRGIIKSTVSKDMANGSVWDEADWIASVSLWWSDLFPTLELIIYDQSLFTSLHPVIILFIRLIVLLTLHTAIIDRGELDNGGWYLLTSIECGDFTSSRIFGLNQREIVDAKSETIRSKNRI